MFAGKVVGTGRDIDNENATRPGKRRGGILADVGTGRQTGLENPTDAGQGGFEFHGRGR